VDDRFEEVIARRELVEKVLIEAGVAPSHLAPEDPYDRWDDVVFVRAGEHRSAVPNKEILRELAEVLDEKEDQREWA